GSGTGPAAAGDLQHRSRVAVYQPGVHRCVGSGWHRDKHGRPRPSAGQRVHRAAVADREIREHLSPGLRDGSRARTRPGVVLRLLPLRAIAHGAGLPDAVGSAFGGSVPATGEMKTLWREKFWPAARLSSHVNSDPIRDRSARPRETWERSRGPCAHTLIHPKTCPTIGVHLSPYSRTRRLDHRSSSVSCVVLRL